jgi:hypothetical protein
MDHKNFDGGQTMRIVTVLILASMIALWPEPIQAFRGEYPTQENEISFESMSLTELEAIDRKTLSRSEQKAHKRALKAEKKRLKAIAKAEAKRAKAIKKRRDRVNNIYKRTQILGYKFDTITTINGPKRYLVKFGSTASHDRYMRAYVKPGELPTIQIVTTKDYDPEVDYLFGGPRDDFGRLPWRNYYAANLPGGLAAPFRSLGHSYIGCERRTCENREVFAIDLDWFYLSELISNNKPIEYKVFARTRGTYVAEFPNDYLLGFFKAVLEVMGEDNQGAQEAFVMIDNALNTLPAAED